MTCSGLARSSVVDDLAIQIIGAIDADVDVLRMSLPSPEVVAALPRHPALSSRVINSRDGAVSVVQGTDSRNDRSRSYSGFGFHVDGLYHARIPDYVLLVCEKPGTAGIETHIAAVDDAIAALSSRDTTLLKSAWFSYLHRDGRRFERPLLERDGIDSRRLWLNLAARGWLRVPTEGDVTAAPDYIDLAQSFVRLYEALQREAAHRIRWGAGEAVLFHNRRHAHARSSSAGTRDPQRRLLRLWLAGADQVA